MRRVVRPGAFQRPPIEWDADSMSVRAHGGMYMIGKTRNGKTTVIRAAKTRNRPHAWSTNARGRSSGTIPAEQGRLPSAQEAIRFRTSNGRWVDRIGVVGLIGKLQFSRSVPEPGRVPSCLHAGSRSVGSQDRPLWSLGIGAHWARHAWRITLGLTITEVAKRKTISFHRLRLADQGDSNALRAPTKPLILLSFSVLWRQPHSVWRNNPTVAARITTFLATLRSNMFPCRARRAYRIHPLLVPPPSRCERRSE